MTKKRKGGTTGGDCGKTTVRLTAPIEGDEYHPTHKVVVRGATAPDGTPWVEIAASGGTPVVWVKFDDLSDDASSAKKRMREGRLHLFKNELSQALDKARKVDVFPAAPLIERSGWSGAYFALLSGEVFSPDGVDEPIILFEPQPDKCAAAGDETWRKGMKRLCSGQPIVTFAVMMPFCAPILRLSRITNNFGVELSGPKARGKSTLQRAAASTAGPVLDPSGKNYWITANTTMNALEAEMPLHNDMFMSIEEMSSMNAGESDRVRANRARELVFRMYEGTGKDRFQAARQPPARFAYLTSTNDPTATLLGANAGDAADAVTDRLLALPISSERIHGIFEEDLPKGYRSGEAAARAIDALVAEHYGHPIRVFLRALVNARAEDEDALKHDIEALIMKFRQAVGVPEGSQGTEARVADAFGLIYAAGRLAQRYGALPWSLKCLTAAVCCHRLNRQSVGAHVTNLERLRQLARREDVIEVNLTDKTKAYRKAVEKAPAMILAKKHSKRELLVTLEVLRDLFPHLKALVTDPEIKPLMRCETGRHSRQVTVVCGKKKRRFFCLRLPDYDD